MKHFKKTVSILLVVMTILTICSTAMPVFAAGNLFSSKTFVAESYVQQEMTSKIVGEVSELREEYAKHFVCEDGSYVVATYTEPVHYKEKGKWKEIDNSLKLNSEVKSGSGKSMYAPKAGPADVSIPQSFSNDQKISATNKGHTISFGVSQGMNVRLNKSATVVSDVEELTSNVSTSDVAMLQKTMTASNALASKESEITAYNNEVMAVENQSGAIVYEDIFNNADLEYIVTTNSIKENIVVQKKQYDYTYSFDMDFGELVPIVNEDNSIRVVDPETEETVFFVAAPYMYDANCMESTDIDMTLVEDDEIYVLTLKASADWINASERVLPVVIDPTVYMSYNDVYVMSGIVNQNNTKLNNEIRIGKNLTNSTRTYIKPEIPTNIPAGSYINNAQLILQKDYYFQGLGASDIYAYAFDCYKIASWDPSTITWKNQPVDNSKNGYANCDLEFLSSVEATSGRTEYPFDITNAVRRWFAGGRNNGIMLASSNESTTTQVDFYSSRAKDSSTYPQIYITYTAPSVSIPRWETDSRAKESSAFTITTSSNWTISSNASWISLSTTSGSGIGSSKIIVTENTSIFDRVGTVTVKMGSTVIGTITVTQYGKKPNIELDITSLNFNAGSSKQTVNITSNTTWSFSNLPEWITVTPSEGSMNSTVEIGVSVNNDADIRESNITVTADTITKIINVVQLNDAEAPAKPNIYEQDGLVYISSRSFDFNKYMDSPEHIEYKIENGEWTNYDGKPLNIVRTYDAKVYARVRDDATNISPIAEITLENTLGEYTASYTDIALGEGLFPVEFGRTYTSTNGWFFTFDANIAKIDDNAYVFTDFYGEKQYFIKNGEGKYLSIDEEELTVNADSYVLTYGQMTCTFSSDGKINRIVTDYLDTVYTWTDNLLTITGGATVTFTNGKPSKINIARTDSEGMEHTKEIEYVWAEGNLTRFIDAADVEHNYAYTNDLLTTNETETITYSVQRRVKLISQPNGAFVKYTYNDTAENAKIPNKFGAVIVSDSKGVTDIRYYADGITISNALKNYSKNALYTPENISNDIVEDVITEMSYITELKDENKNTSTNANIDTEETYETNELNDDMLKVVDNFYCEDISEDKVILYLCDERNRITTTYEVLKSNISFEDTIDLEEIENVAENKTAYWYVSSIDDNVSQKSFYKKENNQLVVQEINLYEYTNGKLSTNILQKNIDNKLTNIRKLDFSYNEYDCIVRYSESEWIEHEWYEIYSESYDYGNANSPISVISTTSVNTITPEVDDNGDKTIVSNSDRVVTEYEYDVWNQPIKIASNNDNETKVVAENTYDILGRITYKVESGMTTSYAYDDNENIITETISVNDGADNKVTICTYEDGNLISKKYPDETVAIYHYDDTYGNLQYHTYKGYCFTYNTLGSILTAGYAVELSESGDIINTGVDMVSYTYTPDIKQDVLKSSFGNNQIIDYEYNSNGDIVAVKLGDTVNYAYTYSPEETVVSEESNGTSIDELERNIDPLVENIEGKWVKITDNVNELFKVIQKNKTSVFDFEGNFIYSVEDRSKGEEKPESLDRKITTIGEDIYTLVVEKDADTFMTNDSIDFVRQYLYNEEGELQRTRVSDVFYTDYDYENNDVTVLENVFDKNDDGEITEGYIFNYGYENENISTETLIVESKAEDGSSDGHTESVSYKYDDKDQLVKADYGDVLYEYFYDYSDEKNIEHECRGNITKKTTTVGGVSQTVLYEYDKTWKDKLISYNGQSISYDVVGNPTNYMGNALTWTMGRQLATFGDISYTYNEDGIRTSKISNGVTTKFLLDGYNVIEQTDGLTTLHFFYDSNGEVIGFRYNENNYFYVKNAMSDIIAVTDSNKNIVAEYRYDPWGKVLGEDNLTAIGALNPFRYRSYYYDSDIKMYYLQSRYYDAEVGRFINCDDVNYIGVTESEISYNPFAYCVNNPTSNIDYFGYAVDFVGFITKILKFMQSLFKDNNVALQVKLCEDVINLSYHRDDILAMETLSQDVKISSKYSIYSIFTRAITKRWYYERKYTIESYSATKEQWNVLIADINKIKNIKDTVDLAVDILDKIHVDDLIKGVGFYKLYLTLVNSSPELGIITAVSGIALSVILYLANNGIDELIEDVGSVNNGDRITINWLVTFNFSGLFVEPENSVLEYYCPFALLFGGLA